MTRKNKQNSGLMLVIELCNVLNEERDKTPV